MAARNVLNFPTAQGPAHQGVSGSAMGQVPFKPKSEGKPPAGALPSPENYYGEQPMGGPQPGYEGPATGTAGAVGGSPGMGVGAFDPQGQSREAGYQGGPPQPPAQPQNPQAAQPPGFLRRTATWVGGKIPWWGWGVLVGGGLLMAYRSGQGKHPVPFLKKKRKNAGKKARVIIDAVEEGEE